MRFSWPREEDELRARVRRDRSRGMASRMALLDRLFDWRRELYRDPIRRARNQAARRANENEARVAFSHLTRHGCK